MAGSESIHDYSYDGFGRLGAMSAYSGGAQLYNWIYDRYGNRWQQNPQQGGQSSNLTFDTATNRINSAGYAYDAAGNMIQDPEHTYKYDAEGNLVQVDNGATATYIYDALNRRVEIEEGVNSEDFVYNLAGQRVSVWDLGTEAQIQGEKYWGNQPIEVDWNTEATFPHEDWLGTIRTVTSYTGSVESQSTNLPFGDGSGATGSGSNPWQFAGLDKDFYSGADSGTDYAQFREYGDAEGRWMSPDSYAGSYDFADPQSLNRYSYVLNNPLGLTDPLGLDWGYDCGPNCIGVVGTVDDGCLACGPAFGAETVTFLPPLPSSSYYRVTTRYINPNLVAENHPCDDSALARRIVAGLQGAVNLGIAGVKIAGVGAADAMLLGGGAAGTTFTGGASDIAASLVGGVITTYGVTSASGQAASGVGQLYDAFSGNGVAGEAVVQAGDILGGPAAGIGTLIAGGSSATADRNAQLEGLATAGNSFLGSQGMREFLTNAADFTLSVLGIGGSRCH